MSEMLGNRYFLARQFDKALQYFETALEQAPDNYRIKKRLIICYVYVGQIERALSFFYDIVKVDPFIIINTDPYYDDCPCLDMIPDWESRLNGEASKKEIYETLGMLYLFCERKKSIEYFRKALNETSYKATINSILKRLNALNTMKSHL
ncbi:MAG TPA: tetratricopeptide repeat protein [Calditrichaeota bacterium]|nr:tetratricopeptide repeat protein [Calditrichota bacterium]